jgi:SAM-dependent methyltransferase
MARYFGLRTAKNLDEIAYADLLIPHEIQEAESRIVTECLKESLDIEGRFRHDLCIRLDVCEGKTYIHLSRYEEAAMSDQILDSVRSKYGAVAESTLSNNHAGVQAVAEAFGYSAEELTSIPADANMGLSCGNPTATAHLRAGEVVVDLGSGGGLDVFLASKMVGPTGRAIGVDMTSSMIERARANAVSGGYTNVEFYLAMIDKIPLPDASVDCVISNCVLNLAPDKPAVFREISRILKPGGRLAVSDIALKHELPEDIAKSMAAYVGCIGGAIKVGDYREGLMAAGFEHVEIVDSGSDLNAYAKLENQAACCSPTMDDATSCCAPAASAEPSVHEELSDLLAKYDVNAAAASVKVYAIKPNASVVESCCGPNCCS